MKNYWTLLLASASAQQEVQPNDASNIVPILPKAAEAVAQPTIPGEAAIIEQLPKVITYKIPAGPVHQMPIAQDTTFSDAFAKAQEAQQAAIHAIEESEHMQKKAEELKAEANKHTLLVKEMMKEAAEKQKKINEQDSYPTQPPLDIHTRNADAVNTEQQEFVTFGSDELEEEVKATLAEVITLFPPTTTPSPPQPAPTTEATTTPEPEKPTLAQVVTLYPPGLGPFTNTPFLPLLTPLQPSNNTRGHMSSFTTTPAPADDQLTIVVKELEPEAPTESEEFEIAITETQLKKPTESTEQTAAPEAFSTAAPIAEPLNTNVAEVITPLAIPESEEETETPITSTGITPPEAPPSTSTVPPTEAEEQDVTPKNEVTTEEVTPEEVTLAPFTGEAFTPQTIGELPVTQPDLLADADGYATEEVTEIEVRTTA